MVTEVNMVPLIDVSLVLLIIFMVVTPMIVESQIKVNLPTSAATDKDQKPPPKPLIAHVREDGAIFLEGQSVPAELVEQTLASLVTDPETQGLLIEADRNVSFQHVVTVMGAAKKIGLIRMSVAVKEERGGKPSAPRP